MTLKENDDTGNDILAVGTRVRALTNNSHDLVIAGESIGTVYCYLETLNMYKVKYSVMDRYNPRLPVAKIVNANEYRNEFEVLDTPQDT